MISLEKIQQWDKLIANIPADGTVLGHVLAPYRDAMVEMLSTIVTLSNALVSANKQCKCGGCSSACEKEGCGGDHPQCSHGCGD